MIKNIFVLFVEQETEHCELILFIHAYKST